MRGFWYYNTPNPSPSSGVFKRKTRKKLRKNLRKKLRKNLRKKTRKNLRKKSREKPCDFIQKTCDFIQNPVKKIL